MAIILSRCAVSLTLVLSGWWWGRFCGCATPCAGNRPTWFTRAGAATLSNLMSATIAGFFIGLGSAQFMSRIRCGQASNPATLYTIGTNESALSADRVGLFKLRWRAKLPRRLPQNGRCRGNLSFKKAIYQARHKTIVSTKTSTVVCAGAVSKNCSPSLSLQIQIHLSDKQKCV